MSSREELIELRGAVEALQARLDSTIQSLPSDAVEELEDGGIILRLDPPVTSIRLGGDGSIRLETPEGQE